MHLLQFNMFLAEGKSIVGTAESSVVKMYTFSHMLSSGTQTTAIQMDHLGFQL